MNYIFLDETEAELYEAVAYYEECSEGLGIEFSRQVYNKKIKWLSFLIGIAFIERVYLNVLNSREVEVI